MIDFHLAQSILADRKFAYLITDEHLSVVQVWGDGTIFPECSPSSLGCSLLDLVPELIGSEAILAEILAGQTPQAQMNLVVRPLADDDVRYISFWQLPYRSAGGAIQGILHLIEDVTEIGRTHQQLAQRRNELQLLQEELTCKNLELAVANAELREMNDLKSTFVAVATHELRNPLTSIIGFLEILQEGDAGPLTRTQRDYLHIIARNVDRLRMLAQGLSNVIRIESGRVEMILQPVDLLTIISQVVETFRAQISEKSQQLAVSSVPDLPLALCDRIWVSQIISNLVSNAIKYTDAQGKIEIQLSTNPQRDQIYVAVADNGIGIAEADQKKLFTRFYRSEQARRQESGMGLGLYIVRSLVELHGGEIWLESEPDVGSTFHLRLPAAV